MSRNDHEDRSDAQLAHYAKHHPGLFARFLALLDPSERTRVQERTGNGFRWLGQRDRKASADDATGGDHA